MRDDDFLETLVDDPCPVCGASLSFVEEPLAGSVRCEQGHRFDAVADPEAESPGSRLRRREDLEETRA